LAELTFLVAMAKDKTPDSCTAVVKGYVVGRTDVGYLTRAIGIPEAFAAKHHGYLIGDCG